MSASTQRQPQDLAVARARRLCRIQRLLPALLVLVFTVLAAPGAGATVPMCSDDGRSIAAPPIMAPNRGLVLEAPRTCPKPNSILIAAAPLDPGSNPTPPSNAPLRAVPVHVPDFPRPYLERRQHEDAASSTGLELVSSIERPPRR